jgi:hypothetical protein
MRGFSVAAECLTNSAHSELYLLALELTQGLSFAPRKNEKIRE